MIVAELQIVACLNIYLREADARSSMVSERFIVVVGSFLASLCVPGSACVLNPLIVVPDPNLAVPARGIMAVCASQAQTKAC